MLPVILRHTGSKAPRRAARAAIPTIKKTTYQMARGLGKITRTSNATLQHVAGDPELGVGGGPGSRQTRLCQQNPRLSTPDLCFPSLLLRHTPCA